MFIRLFLLLLLLPVPLMAAWTGIAAFVGQRESDWLLSSSPEQADIDFYGLRIEEKTKVDLRVGISAGQFDLSLVDPLDVIAAEKYNGKFLALYLRWPITLAERVNFHTAVNYQINLGDESADSDNSEINWTEVGLNVGLSVQLGLLSIRPFINFRSIDGDITSVSETRIFQQDGSVSKGLILDYFVESTAFVRLMLTSGAHQTMMISFAREY